MLYHRRRFFLHRKTKEWFFQAVPRQGLLERKVQELYIEKDPVLLMLNELTRRAC